MSDALLSRRSIRAFEQRPVEQGLLEQILEAAGLAPSAANLQPTRVLVVDAPASLGVVRSAAYGIGAVAAAPLVLVCMVDLAADEWVGDRVAELQQVGALEPIDPTLLTSGAGRPFALKLGERTAVMNGAIAAAYMDLRAVELGLGTCWVHHADFDQIREHFGVPDSFLILTLLAVGHPAEDPALRPRDAGVRWIPSRRG
ncbi:MAG: nitroreductase family protein [Coriobacteriia bacterium]|nr:nitroreductase family protein [Coriobacteriia bacterium]